MQDTNEQEYSFDEIINESSSSPINISQMPGTFWDITDLSYEISERSKGPTMDSFKKDYQNYVNALKSLPKYNENEIRKEILSWDLTAPTIDEFDFEPIYQAYARLIAYRNRMTHLMDIVNQHHDLLSDAIKTLKTLAIRLTTGAKHDKEATATNMVLPLSTALPSISRLKSNLESVAKNIDFNAYQIDKLLQERRSLAKINQGYVNEGNSITYKSKMNEDNYRSKTVYGENKLIIRTANKRIKNN